MHPEARGQCPYLPLFKAGCLGNRLNLSRCHRAGKRYMSPEMGVESQSRLKRFEAPPGRWRRLALNPGTGSPMIFAVREMELILSRSEEHTSELQSLTRISYDVFCLAQKKNHK